MSDDLVKRPREDISTSKMTDSELTLLIGWSELKDKSADRIEQLQKEVLTARRTSNYWKMEHLEGNKRIEQLEAALREIEYLDRPQVRGLPRQISIHEIARTALGEKKDD